MKYEIGFATDIGRKRHQNQDCVGSFLELGLFLVSDGMGGHLGGEVASATAVETVHSFVKQSLLNPNWNCSHVIKQAIQFANQEIYQRSQKEVSLQGMGTTTTALLFQDSLLAIGHVGDSRCYLVRPHQLWQITRDHSLVQEKLQAGLIRREDLKTDKMRHVLTRSVGVEKELSIDTYQIKTQPGDCFIVCSDGLYSILDDKLILEILQKHLFQESGTPQEAVNQLIAEANKQGGDDNITSIIVRIAL